MPVSRRKYDDLSARYQDLGDKHEDLKAELASSRRALLRLSGQYTHLLETGESMAMFAQPSRMQERLDSALAAARAEKSRADHLQARLDDAVGLGAARPLDSRTWQPGYVAPKPDRKPEVAP
jgi:hypothetical protein